MTQLAAASILKRPCVETNRADDLEWYVLQVKPRRERPVVAHLQTIEIESYLPELKANRRAVRSGPVPLFPGYLFARFQVPIDLDRVRYSRGVIRVLGNKTHPTAVPDKVIRTLKSRTGEDGLTDLRVKPKAGDVVRIEAGPFQGFLGRIERELDGGQRVMMLLEALQNAALFVATDMLALEKRA